MDFPKAFVKCDNFKYWCHIKCNLPSVVTSWRGKNLYECLPTPNSFRSNHQCNLLVVRSRLKYWFIYKVSFFDEIILQAVKPINSISRYIGSSCFDFSESVVFPFSIYIDIYRYILTDGVHMYHQYMVCTTSPGFIHTCAVIQRTKAMYTYIHTGQICTSFVILFC